jgi:hypothetical protein
MEGENFVKLIGKISRGSYKEVGQFNTGLFKSSLAIPTSNNKYQYIKIAAWADLAKALRDTDTTEVIKIHGHIEESSYDGKCRHCSGPEKKYWTEVIVDNFVVITEGVEDGE